MTRTQARLLVVDDNAVNRCVVHGLLARAGFTQIDQACDGSAALDLFGATAYDLVITDWQMPVLDGLGLLSAVRSWPDRARIPVMVVTGSSYDEAVVAGADCVLMKPFSRAELVDNVVRLLSAA